MGIRLPLLPVTFPDQSGYTFMGVPAEADAYYAGIHPKAVAGRCTLQILATYLIIRPENPPENEECKGRF